MRTRRRAPPATEDFQLSRMYGGIAAGIDPRARITSAFHSIPTTDDELYAWVWRYLRVRIPRESCCPEHVSPFRAFADAYFARYPMTVWHASRGFGGKSLALATLTLTEAITLGCSTTVLGGSLEQSQRVQAYIAGADPNTRGMFWDAPEAPRDLLASDPTATKIGLTNGARIVALAASGKSVRGPHPQRLRLDECDEMDLQIFDSAMGQTMRGRSNVAPQTVCSSTHHVPDGTMTEILRRAAEYGWPVYEWCYRENMEPQGWLEQAEVDRKKLEVTAAMWDVEYELQEPAPGRRAIDPDSVKQMFQVKYGRFLGQPAEKIQIVDPVHLKRFYHGGDFAKSDDWTVVVTHEERTGPDLVCCWERDGRKPWPMMVKLYDDRLHEYQGAAFHDATGVGEVVTDYLTASWSIGFDFRHVKKRAEMLSNYIAAIENRLIEAPMIEYAYKAHLYATVEDVYGGGTTHHLPDPIAAGGLAWHAKYHGSGAYEMGDFGGPIRR